MNININNNKMCSGDLAWHLLDITSHCNTPQWIFVLYTFKADRLKERT